VHAQTPPRRLLFLSCLAALLGAAGGGAAWVLLHLIGLLTNLALFHRFGWELPSFRDLAPSPWIVVSAVTGAFLVSLLAKWSPVIRGHGIPETMEAVLVRQSRISPRAALAKPLSAALAIGIGGPFGAVVSVAPDDTVFRALQRLLEEEVEHLPVITGGKLAGICTRSDVLRTRRHQLELERRQPGWKVLASRKTG
jgi:hypothetical protein